MEKKKKYSPPQTLRFEVEIESGFMNGSIGDMPEDTKSITISPQAPGVAVGKGDGTGDWDNTTWGDSWD